MNRKFRRTKILAAVLGIGLSSCASRTDSQSVGSATSQAAVTTTMVAAPTTTVVESVYSISNTVTDDTGYTYEVKVNFAGLADAVSGPGNSDPGLFSVGFNAASWPFSVANLSDRYKDFSFKYHALLIYELDGDICGVIAGKHRNPFPINERYCGVNRGSIEFYGLGGGETREAIVEAGGIYFKNAGTEGELPDLISKLNSPVATVLVASIAGKPAERICRFDTSRQELIIIDGAFDCS